ncbi:MAG: Gfo/Idh/MocA family oxidoreductase [Anaerolineales bacterium]|nr:Gfo/Idh/MocA family oxidoreductase [Anaerolineales bacterium]
MSEKSINPVTLAILGAGDIARKAYFPLLRTTSDFSIQTVYSRTEETLSHIRAAWGFENTTTRIETILEQKPQAALVLTNTASHFKLASQLLEAGIDVYIEKPATEYSHETHKLAELAKQNNCILMIGFNRRYSLLYRQAREIFGDRRMNLCVVEKHRSSAYHISLYNNHLDDAIHQIDLLRFFGGENEPEFSTFQFENGKVTSAMAATRLEQGGKGVLLDSYQAGGWQEQVTLHGDGISILVKAFQEIIVREGDKETHYGIDRPGKWLPSLVERGFGPAMDHFHACILNRSQPKTDGVEGARTQELAEKLVRAAGEPVEVKPMENRVHPFHGTPVEY